MDVVVPTGDDGATAVSLLYSASCAPYPRAIRETLGEGVVHRCGQYLNNKIEQDRRGIKRRYHPMRGFRSFHSAALLGL